MSRNRRLSLIAGGIPLALLLLLVSAWAIDSAGSGDRVMRNVLADGTELGGLEADEVQSIANDLTQRLSGQPATLTVGSTVIETDPVSLGAVVDGDALAEAALDARRDGFALFAPVRWLGSFFTDVEIDVPYEVDPAAAEAATEELIGGVLELPIEPSFELAGGSLTVVPGTVGSQVEDGALVAEVARVMAAPAPYEAKVELIPLDPLVDTDTLEALAAEANDATAQPVNVNILNSSATVDTATLRSWVTLEIDEDDVASWAIDEPTALDALAPQFIGLGGEDQQARFDIVDGVPVIIPASESVVCCGDDSGERIREGLDQDLLPEAGEDEEQELRAITLEPEVTGSDAGVAALEALGIVEEVSSFTTNHSCCENRVTNIQLMADTVRGYVIRPGERFDLNGIVGQRTRAKGYLPAGAIAQGVTEDQVGGGVSQFTTTIFNAAFFAGIDFIEYQSHSLYFSRYPRGREATISWTKPDFIVENNTDYGILVWPTYTGTSITVTFYSTKNVDVTCVMGDGSLVEGPGGCDSAVRHSSQGACNRYTTVRNRVFADGSSDEDSVFAVYRPGQGLDCAGNSTVPTTTTAPPAVTEPTVAPEPTEAPAPTTPPTTAAPVTTPDPDPDPAPDPDPDAGEGEGG